jgi:cysteinyl-tRNA synthetase, unknown class
VAEARPGRDSGHANTQPWGRRIVAAAVLLLLATACRPDPLETESRDYRQDMRDFVQAISDHAKDAAPAFLVIPQNGHELLTVDGDPGGNGSTDYLAAIDGIGREDLNYGYDGDNIATNEVDTDEMLPFLDLAVAQGVEVLVTDYCWGTTNVDDSYSANAAAGYISFAADSRDLNTIPGYPASVPNTNTETISSLAEAGNFLYLLDPSEFLTKDAYLTAIGATNYDVVIIDLFYEDANGAVSALTREDIDSIDSKPGGGARLIICYMSIGEAEDYRYYWDPAWEHDTPAWLGDENRHWAGNYKVRYWNVDWQAVVFGAPDAYLDRILAAGFDGVYLDIIDAYEFFEDSSE